MSDFSEEKKVALEAVQKALNFAAKIQAQLQDEDILKKEDLSPVTIADLGSQALIIEALQNFFPQDAIAAEEDAFFLKDAPIKEKILAHLPDFSAEKLLKTLNGGQAKVGPKGRFWILDPIDGTKGFIRGDHYCHALALIVDGKVVFGMLGCPRLNATFYAEKGKGAYKLTEEKEERLFCDPSKFSPDELIYCEPHLYSKTHLHKVTYKIANTLKPHVKPIRIESQEKYPLVASNEASFYIRISPLGREKIWDHAAGSLIVEEAGGIVTDLRGKPLNFTLGNNLFENEGIMASNGQDHANILTAIKNELYN